MKSVIVQQLEERDRLMRSTYTSRNQLNEAMTYLTAKPIKLITGPRRAGKSTLALQMLKGQKFAYLNFDDAELLDNFNEDSLSVALADVYGEYEYLLLDEVQNLDGWSMWVEKLYRRGANLIITGSNAKLLSDDMAAILSGRFLEIRLYPFSAAEYLSFRNVCLDKDSVSSRAAYVSALTEFSNFGGYPEVAGNNNVVAGYLSALYDSILLKDIVRRYKVRKVSELYNVANWLLTNFTGMFNISSLAVELNMGSKTTVLKYCEYLQNTFLFQYLPRFDNKLKLMKKADRKAYVIDTGFISARAFELSSNLGRILENMVFLELLKRGYDLKRYELFYYRSRNDREVDFVLRKGIKIISMIQVCYDMSSPKTREREIKSLVECAGELRNESLYIITWMESGTIKKGDYTITVIPFYNWIQG